MSSKNSDRKVSRKRPINTPLVYNNTKSAAFKPDPGERLLYTFYGMVYKKNRGQKRWDQIGESFLPISLLQMKSSFENPFKIVISDQNVRLVEYLIVTDTKMKIDGEFVQWSSYQDTFGARFSHERLASELHFAVERMISTMAQTADLISKNKDFYESKIAPMQAARKGRSAKMANEIVVEVFINNAATSTKFSISPSASLKDLLDKVAQHLSVSPMQCSLQLSPKPDGEIPEYKPQKPVGALNPKIVYLNVNEDSLKPGHDSPSVNEPSEGSVVINHEEKQPEVSSPSANEPSKESEVIKREENQPDVSPITQNTNDVKSNQHIIQEDNGNIVTQNEKQPDVSVATKDTNDIKSTQEVTQDSYKVMTQNEVNHLEQLEGDLQPSNHDSQTDINDITASSNIDDTHADNEQNLQTPHQELTETTNQDDEQTPIVDYDSQTINVAVLEHHDDTMINPVTDASPTDHDNLAHTNNDSVPDDTKIEDTEISTSVPTESVEDDNNQTSNQLEALNCDTEVTDDHHNVDVEVEQSSALLEAEVSQNYLANEQTNSTEIPERVSTITETKDEIETSEHASEDNQTSVTEDEQTSVTESPEDPPDSVKATVISNTDSDIESGREFNKPEHSSDHSDTEKHLEQSTVVADSENIQVDAGGDTSTIASHQNTIGSNHVVNDEKAESTANTVTNNEITDEIIIDAVDSNAVQPNEDPTQNNVSPIVPTTTEEKRNIQPLPLNDEHLKQHQFNRQMSSPAELVAPTTTRRKARAPPPPVANARKDTKERIKKVVAPPPPPLKKSAGYAAHNVAPAISEKEEVRNFQNGNVNHQASTDSRPRASTAPTADDSDKMKIATSVRKVKRQAPPPPPPSSKVASNKNPDMSKIINEKHKIKGKGETPENPIFKIPPPPPGLPPTKANKPAILDSDIDLNQLYFNGKSMMDLLKENSKFNGELF